MVGTFSRSELESFTKKQLQVLATYYQIPHTNNTKKEDLVEAIAVIVCTPPISETEIPMSARVRRIYEQNKKEN